MKDFLNWLRGRHPDGTKWSDEEIEESYDFWIGLDWYVMKFPASGAVFQCPLEYCKKTVWNIDPKASLTCTNPKKHSSKTVIMKKIRG